MSTGLTNIGAALSDTSTTDSYGLGALTIQGGTEYTWIRATAAIAVGDALVVDTGSAAYEPFGLTPASAVNQPIEAVSPVAIASGSYGWVVTRGRVPSGKVAASTAAGAQLGTSATAGTLSTISISGTYTQAEIQRVLAAATGKAVIAVDAESGGLAELQVK